MNATREDIGATDAVHAGDPRPKAFDAISPPIVQSSTFTFESTAEILAFKAGTHPRSDREEYGRYGNPTCRALEKRMAALEGADDALVFPSGMAAITTTLLALVKAGQHIVFFKDGYRMTRRFITGTLAGLGVSHTLVDAGDLVALRDAIRPETRLVVSESPTNPYLSCIDLAGLALVCKAHRAVRSLIDATFASPVNCRPISMGIDLVIHSATKYLAGHNDVLAGVVSGPEGLVSMVRDLRGVLGSICDPHAAFLVARGLKTLALRVQQQNASAMAIAAHLETHPAIDRVYYPGLASHPDHAIAKKQMRGFGGVVTFVVKGGLDAACSVVDRLQIPQIGPSFGGVESLVEPPEIMSYYEMSRQERAALGIDEGLVRLAVGIEDAGDVIRDLDRALGR